MSAQKPQTLLPAHGASSLWVSSLMIGLIFAAMCLTAFAFPLAVPQPILDTWCGSWLGKTLRIERWAMTYFSMGNTASVLKESFMLMTLLPLGVVLLLQSLFYGRPTQPAPVVQRLRNPYLWFVAIWVYFAMRCLPKADCIPAAWSSPTPQAGLFNLAFVTCGLLILVALYRLRFQWSKITRLFMNLTCVIGALFALLAVAQHLGWTSSYLLTAPDVRNRLGGLLGHNVAVSTWLIFPLSFSVYYLFRPQSGTVRRGLHGLLILLIMWVIVAAQSRSVWLLGGVLIPLYFWVQMRGFGFAKQTVIRTALIGLLIVVAAVATQTLRPGSNPLAGKHATSLRERIKRLSISELKTETRVRVPVCSMSLIAAKPLIGHGLGAFQYVYQPAQGEWLARNRDSFVVGTWKRTDVAHNDPLQLLIETGFVGALLILIPFVMLLRRGWRFQHTAVQDEAAQRNALLMPLALVLAQSLIDFPFHVTSLSMLWLIGFGLWSSGPQTLDPAPDTATPAKGRQYRLAIAVCVMCATYAIGVFLFDVQRRLVADHLFARGSRILAVAQGHHDMLYDEKLQILGYAKSWLRNAVHANIFYGQAYESAALADIETGRIFENMALENPQAENANTLRGSAQNSYDAATDKIRSMLEFGELNYHYSHYLMGQANLGLWRTSNDSQYLVAARNNFNTGVVMNPYDTFCLAELGRAWETQPTANRANAIKAKQQLFDVNAAAAYEEFLRPIMSNIQNGQFAAATVQITTLGNELPNEWRVRLMLAEHALHEAQWAPAALDCQTTGSLRDTPWAQQRLKTAEKILREVTPVAPEYDAPICTTWLRYYCAVGDYAAALEMADIAVQRHPQLHEFAALRMILAKQLDEERPLPMILNDQPSILDNFRDYYNTFFFDNRYAVLGRLMHLVQVPDIEIDTVTFPRIVAYLLNNGGTEDAKRLADWLQEREPHSKRNEAVKAMMTPKKQTP